MISVSQGLIQAKFKIRFSPLILDIKKNQSTLIYSCGSKQVSEVSNDLSIECDLTFIQRPAT